jgi:hypothetical protein
MRCSSGLIERVYKMMQIMREGSVPLLIYSRRQSYKLVREESTSYVRLGVLYMDPKYYPFVFLALHASRCRAAQVK